MFFTIPIDYLGKFKYRTITARNNNFWFKYRHIKPHEIYKNDHQMEQWVWLNLLKEGTPYLKKDCSLNDYWLFLHKNILVVNPKQIGYLWNRSSDFYLNNCSRFAPSGNGLMKSAQPFRDFFSYSLINSYLLIRNTNLSNYFHNARKFLPLRNFFILLFHSHFTT